jgi:hypothetical protein
MAVNVGSNQENVNIQQNFSKTLLTHTKPHEEQANSYLVHVIRFLLGLSEKIHHP